MDVTVRWHQPIPLKKINGAFSYDSPTLKAMEGPGIYFFARRVGKKIVPLYIGQTTKQSLAKRLAQHLDKPTLLNNLEHAIKGGLFYVFGTVVAKPATQIESALEIIESALIQEVLAENKELFNQKGTRRSAHTVSFTGNQTARTVIDKKTMKIRKD